MMLPALKRSLDGFEFRGQPLLRWIRHTIKAPLGELGLTVVPCPAAE
jgi:hypothetical protein